MERLTSAQHPLVKHLHRLRMNRATRHTEQRLVVEGIKMVQELPASLHVHTLLHVEGVSVDVEADKIYCVPMHIIEKIAGSRSPEGVIAEVEMPSQLLEQPQMDNAKRVVILDRVADPGNIGTLIRTARSFNWDAVWLTDDCCDPFNDKALRAAKGATFRLPLAVAPREQLIDKASALGLTLLAADAQGQPHIDPPASCALVLGSEAHGLSQTFHDAAQLVSIPIAGMESLNVAVAGGILMHELRGDL